MIRELVATLPASVWNLCRVDPHRLKRQPAAPVAHHVLVVNAIHGGGGCTTRAIAGDGPREHGDTPGRRAGDTHADDSFLAMVQPLHLGIPNFQPNKSVLLVRSGRE